MRRLAVLLAFAALAAPSAQTQAGHFGEACRISWTGSGSCNISFFGPPVTYYADAAWRPGHTGSLRVRAWLTYLGTTSPRLLECETVVSSGIATCERAVAFYPGFDLGATSVALTCHVEGAPGGELNCATGRGS